MHIGYIKNHTGGTYLMLNLSKKHAVISHHVICMNETYGEYVSSQEQTKYETYIFQDEDKFNTWDNVKVDPIKTENIKTNQNDKFNQDYRG